LILFLGLVVSFGGVTAALGQEGATPPHWIWYPTGQASNETAAESRHFRKSFFVKEPSRLVLDATADNAFTLYLDGKPVATGEDWHTTQSFETKLAIDLGSDPRWLQALASLCGRLHSDKLTAMESELRALIIDKLGRRR